MTQQSEDRPLDVVVMGATGFTGRLLSEVLSQHPRARFRWGIAGRNAEKLNRLGEQLVALGRGPDRVLVADSRDPDGLRELASSTRSVATTVGPYSLYGDGLVEACVESGTHYADLTGEVPWVRRMIDTHHERAAQNGARIVHCCGFDSIPSDLGTFALQEALIDRDGRPAEEVKLFVMGAKGGVSGGTIASLFNVLEETSSKEVRRTLASPYSLNPEGMRSGPDRERFQIAKDPVTGWWTGPFVMEAINARVVRRSNALLGNRYGENFRYSEVTRFSKGVLGSLRAAAFTGAFGAFLGAAAFAPTRRFMARYVLPKPGEGPKPEAIERGFFKILLSGRRNHEEVGRVEVRGRRDPGYGATSCMLAESALCLALDPLESQGGILTPASAMGHHLIQRLNASDVHFKVEV
ncbi:MAG: saccharopine dehydrogenase family protein [Myxococcota bacterium]